MQLGYSEPVGTTLKDTELLSAHLLGDEKHTRFNGEKAYIATTVGTNWVLGIALALKADEASWATA